MPVNTTFRGIDYFESTFRNQINANGEIENREFVFKNSFGEGVDQNPVEAGRYRIIWMPGCPHGFADSPEHKDAATGAYFLSEFYKNADPDFHVQLPVCQYGIWTDDV